MVKERDLWSCIEEYLKDNNIDIRRRDYFKFWPVIAGPRLSSCTRLERVEEKKERIVVSASSLSSRSLLTMERERIKENWNKTFVDCQIKDIVIKR